MKINKPSCLARYFIKLGLNMISFNTEISVQKLQESIRRDFAKITNFQVPLKRSGVFMLKATSDNFTRQQSPSGQRWPKPNKITLASRAGGGGGGKSLLDSGRLKSSVSFVPQSMDTIKIFAIKKSGGVDIAKVMQEGATIKPKTKKFLTIPLSRKAKLKSAREHENTFIQKSKKGNLIIFQNKEDGKIEPLYWLRKQVTIPARPFLGFSTRNADDITKVFIRYTDEQLRK